MSNADQEMLSLSQVQLRYLTWLLTDEDARIPNTELRFAKENYVDVGELKHWRENNPDFRRMYGYRLAQQHASPERWAEMVDVIHKIALGEAPDYADKAAAKLYLELTEPLRPPILVVQDEDWSGISADEAMRFACKAAIVAGAEANQSQRATLNRLTRMFKELWHELGLDEDE